jgi:hypothetical protein
MDLARFSDLIDRLGEDLSGWPEPDRAAAADLLARSVAARSMLDEALALRRALASPAVRAPEGLVDRITAAARDLKQPAAKPAGDAGRAAKVEPADR